MTANSVVFASVLLESNSFKGSLKDREWQNMIKGVPECPEAVVMIKGNQARCPVRMPSAVRSNEVVLRDLAIQLGLAGRARRRSCGRCRIGNSGLEVVASQAFGRQNRARALADVMPANWATLIFLSEARNSRICPRRAGWFLLSFPR